jgi:glycosyltransferase 2 family protein
MDRLGEAPEPRESGRGTRIVKTLAGYLVAAACLAWVFHDVRIAEVAGHIRRMTWWWLAPAIAFDVLSYASQGLRWSILIRPTGRVSALRATRAVYAGLFVNEILPMRVGEVMRTWLVSRWIAAPFSAVVPSVLAERFFDAVWLALAFGATVFLVPLPRFLVDAEEILGSGVLAATILLAYLVFRARKKPAGPEEGETAGHQVWWTRVFHELASGLREIGRSRFLYWSFVVSGLLLAGQVLAFWCVMRAYGIQLSVWVGAAVLLILHVGTAIPSAPSNVGTYQFFTVMGLTLFDVDKTLATGFSVVVFLVLTIPLWAIGLLAFLGSGLTLRGIQNEVARLKRSMEKIP